MDIQFQWVDFYNEFANKLFAYKNSRTDLVRKAKAIYENTGINMPTLEKDNQLVNEETILNYIKEQEENDKLEEMGVGNFVPSLH